MFEFRYFSVPSRIHFLRPPLNGRHGLHMFEACVVVGFVSVVVVSLRTTESFLRPVDLQLSDLHDLHAISFVIKEIYHQ